jgi:hypothetical protein
MERAELEYEHEEATSSTGEPTTQNQPKTKANNNTIKAKNATINGSGNSGQEGGESDDDDDDEDDSDGDDDDDKGGRPRVGKRPTVKEHSKAQREKRKMMLDYLESEAKKVSLEMERRAARSAEMFAALERERRVYRTHTDTFLQFWFGPSELTTLEAAADGHGERSWKSIVEVERLVVKMPVLMSFWVPPTRGAAPATGTGTGTATASGKQAAHRLQLRTPSQIKGYKAGFNLLCSSIARFGTNVAESLIFNALLKTEATIVSKNTLASKFSLVSKNAKLCGANAEISFSGTIF